MVAHVKETPSEPKANDGLHEMPTKAGADITDLPPDVCLLIIESMWSWRDQWSARLSCRSLYLGFLKWNAAEQVWGYNLPSTMCIGRADKPVWVIG